MGKDAGGRGGGKRGGRFDKYGWETVGSSTDPIDSGGGDDWDVVGGSRFDPGRLTRTTPYTVPTPTTTRSLSPGQPEPPSWSPGARGSWPSSDPTGKVNPVRRKDEEQPKPKARQTYQLTWDEYNALSDSQRAAVDFNTLLVRAREKDLNAEYKDKPERRKIYDDAVEEMFGKGRGSETFAPETVAVLKQVGFTGDGEADLDEFLGLDKTISAKELPKFDLDPVKVKADLTLPLIGDTTVKGEGYATTEQSLAAGTDRLRETLAKSNQLLQNFRASAARDRNDEVLAFGGRFNDVKTAPGYGDAPVQQGQGNIHTFFREAFASLANKSADQDQVWAALNDTLKPNEMQQFMRYADERTRSALESGVGLGEGKDWRDPQEFRKLLQLDKSGA